MRCVVQHANPLVQGPYHHVVFIGIHVLDGFFEIAHTAMNDLRSRARSCPGEITSLQQYRAEPAKLSIKRTTRARRAAANHADVKRISSYVSQLLFSISHGYSSRSEVDFYTRAQHGGSGNSRISANVPIVL